MKKIRGAQVSKRSDLIGSGRQRSQAAEKAILAATLAILVEQGYAGFTIKRVIDRAGVSSATLYRRWATADELVIAALRDIGPEPRHIDTGSFDADLGELINYLGEAMASYVEIAAVEASGRYSSRAINEEIAKMFAAPRIAMLQDILNRAQARGELGKLPKMADCWNFVASPIHHRLYIAGEKFTKRFSLEMKTFLIAGFIALSPVSKKE